MWLIHLKVSPIRKLLKISLFRNVNINTDLSSYYAEFLHLTCPHRLYFRFVISIDLCKYFPKFEYDWCFRLLNFYRKILYENKMDMYVCLVHPIFYCDKSDNDFCCKNNPSKKQYYSNRQHQNRQILETTIIRQKLDANIYFVLFNIYSNLFCTFWELFCCSL